MGLAPHSVFNSNSHISMFQEVGGVLADPTTTAPAGFPSLPHTDIGLFPMPKPFPPIITPPPHFIFGVTPCCFWDPKYFNSFIPSLILKLFNSPPSQFCAILSLSFLFTTFSVFTHITCLFSPSQ